MAKLFKKLPASEKKTIRYEILLSVKDAESIRTSAHIRNLSVADFIRRCALGRRADVKFDTEIVLILRDVVQSIRQLNATFTSEKVIPPKHELGLLIDEALAAMLRISK